MTDNFFLPNVFVGYFYHHMKSYPYSSCIIAVIPNHTGGRLLLSSPLPESCIYKPQSFPSQNFLPFPFIFLLDLGILLTLGLIHLCLLTVNFLSHFKIQVRV